MAGDGAACPERVPDRVRHPPRSPAIIMPAGAARACGARSGAPRAARASHRRRRRLGAGDSLSRIMGQLGAPRSPVPLAVLLVIGLECARHASIVAASERGHIGDTCRDPSVLARGCGGAAESESVASPTLRAEAGWAYFGRGAGSCGAWLACPGILSRMPVALSWEWPPGWLAANSCKSAWVRWPSGVAK